MIPNDTIPPPLGSPKEVFAALNVHVFDQDEALQQLSTALFKRIHHLSSGNLLIIGNSGTGKTTLMRAIESLFSRHPQLQSFGNTLRLNANLLSESEQKTPDSNLVIRQLMDNALTKLGKEATKDRFKQMMEHAVVFVDEVDKIRSHVGERVNAAGIRAQEALLTLIEGEEISLFPLLRGEPNPEGQAVTINTRDILFVCGGAFEGLYDSVYRRVAGGETRDRLVEELVIDDQQLDKKEQFHLRDYLRYEDLFTYGMTPQFLGRFDDVILLNDLSLKGLMRIFLEGEFSPFREAQAYFRSLGIELKITREALTKLAEAAQMEHRIGARALRQVFKKIIKPLEFEPHDHYLCRKTPKGMELTITTSYLETVI
jgi:ATP-dependent Clp protease ATP-binding subunit ClpX